MSIQLITHDYEFETTREKLPVVVEFYAEWCPKCAMMKDVVERLAIQMKEICIFKKVNIDLSEDITDMLGIETVPTFVIYKHGDITGYTTGVLSGEMLEDRILKLL